MNEINVLLPTSNRLHSLVMTLSGLAVQSLANFHLIVADQSDEPVAEVDVVRALSRVIAARGGSVEWHHRIPPLGIAEQRDFLLRRASAKYVLYLDDDILMEPWVLERMEQVLRTERCAFVGAFPAGLSFLEDRRPGQQTIEYWEGSVRPEAVDPGSANWERRHLHRAANLCHVAQTLKPGETHLYKVAWVAGCVLYNRQMLLDVGGFAFWPRLPRFHSGEEVLVQNLLMRRWGGCAMIPPGTYYAEVPSTVLNSAGTVDGHALALLPEMIERYGSVEPPAGSISSQGSTVSNFAHEQS